MKAISEEQKNKAMKAHDDKLTIGEAAAKTGMCRHTVANEWNNNELKPNYKKSSPRNKHVPVETFKEDVFYSQHYELGFLEIKERVEKSLGHLVDKETLAKGLDSMVEQGIYERIPSYKGELYRLADLI